MISTEEQKAMDEELLRECGGYHRSRNKPDGAYIQVGLYFFNINKIKRLIASGADVNAKNENGQTPLHWAVLEDRIEMAKLLIASGADVGAKNKDGETPLHWAVDNDNIEIAKLLIDSGAKVNVKKRNGDTPLDWADSQEMEALLIEHGAK